VVEISRIRLVVIAQIGAGQESSSCGIPLRFPASAAET
jgi:hypothetical protein